MITVPKLAAVICSYNFCLVMKRIPVLHLTKILYFCYINILEVAKVSYNFKAVKVVSRMTGNRHFRLLLDILLPLITCRKRCHLTIMKITV